MYDYIKLLFQVAWISIGQAWITILNKGTHLEITQNCDVNELTANFPDTAEYKLVRARDAHFLKDILEPGFMVEIAQSGVEETDISLIISALQ